jgi:hypothetical protein
VRVNTFHTMQTFRKWRSNGSGSLYRKIISPNCFWPNVFWPKSRLTERHLAEHYFTERPFDRNTIWPKVHFTEKSHLAETKLIKRSFDRKYLRNGHLSENQFWKTSQMPEMTFVRKFIWPNVHLTESFFGKWTLDPKVFWSNVFFFEKWSFDRFFFDKR